MTGCASVSRSLGGTRSEARWTLHCRPEALTRPPAGERGPLSDRFQGPAFAGMDASARSGTVSPSGTCATLKEISRACPHSNGTGHALRHDERLEDGPDVMVDHQIRKLIELGRLPIDDR